MDVISMAICFVVGWFLGCTFVAYRLHKLTSIDTNTSNREKHIKTKFGINSDQVVYTINDARDELLKWLFNNGVPFDCVIKDKSELILYVYDEAYLELIPDEVNFHKVNKRVTL